MEDFNILGVTFTADYIMTGDEIAQTWMSPAEFQTVEVRRVFLDGEDVTDFAETYGIIDKIVEMIEEER